MTNTPSFLSRHDSQLSKLRSKPVNLIENRIGFAGKESLLCIYDTYQTCKEIELQSEGITLCGMLTGKKVVQYDGKLIDFTPGQSFAMSHQQKILIDFPDAQINNPTTCLTISLTPQRIQQVCDQLNLHQSLTATQQEWQYDAQNHLHLNLSQPTQALLERLVHLYSENQTERDLMIELGISELIVRMLQQQGKHFLLQQLRTDPESTGLHKALHFIEHHLDEPLDIQQLSKLACMSRSKFFTQFKHHLGCTPQQFQIQRRMEKAAEQLKNGHSVTQACLDNGFKNVSHFSRRFQQYFGLSPREFKNTH